MNFYFLKFLRSTVSWTRMTNWYKKRERKEIGLSCHERETKEQSSGIEPNTFRFRAPTLYHSKYARSYQQKLNMKFLPLIIIIPASLLHLFSEGSLLLQFSSVGMSAKGKESQTVMSIKTHFTKFVKWVTSRSRN